MTYSVSTVIESGTVHPVAQNSTEVTTKQSYSEKIVQEIETKPMSLTGEKDRTPELNPSVKPENNETDWDLEEKELFGSPLLEPSPERTDPFIDGGVSTPSTSSENLTPEPTKQVLAETDMLNEELKFSRDVSPPFDFSDNKDVIESLYGSTKSVKERTESEHSEFEEDAFDCQYCGSRWPKVGSLNKHITSKHKEEKAQFLKKNSNTDELFVPCTFAGCSSAFLSRQARQNHRNIAHKVRGSEASDGEESLSSDETEDAGNESEHLDTTEDVFDCQYCGIRWDKLGSLNKHITSKHKEEKAEFLKNKDSNGDDAFLHCKFTGCKGVFLTEVARRHHSILVHNHDYDIDEEVESEVFSCPYCPAEYTIYKSLYSHYLRNHRDRPRFSIAENRKGVYENKESQSDTESIDDDVFSPKTNRKSSGASEEKSKGSHLLGCNYCMATFDRLERLIAHKKRYHQKDMDDEEISENEPQQEESGSFPCKHSECDRDFPTHKARATHMARAHKEFKAFACDYCPESFSVSKALIVHVQRNHPAGTEIRLQRSHPEETEIKLPNTEEHFVCPHCPKKYEKLNSLQGHLLRVHPGTPRFTAEELKRIGDAEEHFVCPHCPKKYERLNSLQVHISRVHRDTPRRTAEGLNRISGTDYNDDAKVEKPVIEEPMKRGRGRPSLVKPQKETFTPPAAVDPLKCDMCNKLFATVDFLQKHKLTHTPVDMTKTFCDVCGQVFKGPQYVARHKKFSACGGTIKMETESPSNEDTVPSTASRKRRHEETSDNIDQEGSVNESMDMSPPKTKQPLMKEDNVVKTEQNDSYEMIHQKSPMVASIKPEPVWNNVMKSGEPKLNQSILSQISSIASDQPSRRCSMSNVNEGNNVPGEVECSPFPLSTAIFNRAVQFPNEVMVAWSMNLEEDLLAAANMNTANTILCVQELEVLQLSDEAKATLKKSHMITLTMLTSNDTTSQWTIITFGEQLPPAGLKNKLFTQFQNVENIFVQDAATRNMEVVNILRYTKDGLFPMLSKSFNKKTIGFNYQQ